MFNKQNDNKINKQEMTLLRRYLSLTCTLAIGVLVSFILFAIVNHWEHENQRIEFESRSTGYANAVQSTIYSYIDGLKFVGDFFKNSEQVTREEFSGFVMGAIARHPGIQAFSWNPLVLNNERAEYEARAQEEGFENFMFTERTEKKELTRAAQRDEYVIVYYIEPMEANNPAFGFNIASNPTRLKAINQGFDTGKLSATDRITLVQETGEQFGILLLLPIYKKNVPLKTTEDRLKHRKGFVVEVLRIGDIVENALKDFSDEGIDVYLYDLSAKEANRFLYFRPSRIHGMTKQHLEIEEIQNSLYWSKNFDLAGRQWQMLFSPSSFYIDSQQSWHAWIVLSGSLLLTGILAFYLSRKSIYTDEIEQRVKKQTQTNLKLEIEIAEHRKSEMALINEKEKLQRYLDISAVMVVMLDADQRVTLINKKGCEILGCVSEETIGKNWFDNFIPEKKRDAVKVVFDKLMAGEIEPVDYYENEVLTKNGEERLIAWYNTVFRDKDGNITNTMGTGADITDRKKTEEALQESELRFRLMMQQSPSVIELYNQDGLQIEVNRAYEKLWGFPASHTVNKFNVLKSKEVEDTGLMKYVKEAYAGNSVKVPVYRFDSTGETEGKGQGRIRWLNTRIYPLKDRAGNIKNIVITHEDVSDIKFAEEERESLNVELAQKNRELEQIVYVTSHDLRTPLINIDGFTKMIGESLDKLISILDSDRVSAEVKEEIASIVEKDIPEAEKFISSSVVKMESLLSGLLQISRIGRLEQKKVILDMNKMISVIQDTSKFQIEKAGVNLKVSELPFCKGDETQINQLFSNLIDNALKYLDPARPGVIKISGHKENGSSVYCVEDNGIGIKPEHQGKIFEIFHQLNPNEYQGDGLGLSIAGRILDRHSGKVWVESEVGKGSKFFVSLPRA